MSLDVFRIVKHAIDFRGWDFVARLVLNGGGHIVDRRSPLWNSIKKPPKDGSSQNVPAIVSPEYRRHTKGEAKALSNNYAFL